MIRRQINEITEGIESLGRSQGARFSVKQLEKTKRNLEAKLKKLTENPKRDDVVTFEELGIDKMFVDEAHSFKNLFLYTKMRNVAGIQQTEAQKSADLYMKCQYLDEITGGKGIVFATGTPVSNSMTELYTMMRYLQADKLKEMGMHNFDAWAANFGEAVTAIELAPEGTGYRAKTRFSKFFNLPELINVFKECGVHIFVFETFSELGFIAKAIETVGNDGFVITQFAINQFGYSSAGFSARKLIDEAGSNPYIDACGFNCGVGPGHMKKLVQSLINRNDKFFAVLPNAGYPQVVI